MIVTFAKSDGSWPTCALPRGTTVNGYLIEHVLGSGGFGITYLAYDVLRQPFAVKEYFPRQFATRARDSLNVVAVTGDEAPLFEDCRERFLREAQALVLLGQRSHAKDGIVRVYTCFKAYNTCYLVMEYIRGVNLASALNEQPYGLEATRVRSLLYQLLRGVRTVHHAGLLHRDIKPANIVLREDDSPVLIDFGSSRPVERGDLSAYTQIYSGSYAPPEQRLGHSQGEFSDIYAIGAVCYRAIGGRIEDALARHNAAVAGKPDPQRPAVEIGAGRYPYSLLALIDAALATDPMTRPQTADIMLEELDRDELADTVRVVSHDPAAPEQGVPGLEAPDSVTRDLVPRKRLGTAVAVAAAGALTVLGLTYFLLPVPASQVSSVRPPVAVLIDDGASTETPAAPRPPSTDDTVSKGELPEARSLINTAQEPAQIPPPNPPVPQPLPRIVGEAGGVSGDGYLIVDEVSVRLYGVAEISADKAAIVSKWISSHGGRLECELSDADGHYTCFTAAEKFDAASIQRRDISQGQKIDVGLTLLLNGAARATSDATPRYLDAEAQARATSRGVWKGAQ